MSAEERGGAPPKRNSTASFFAICIVAIGLTHFGALTLRWAGEASIEMLLGVLCLDAAVAAIGVCYLAMRASERP